MAVTAGMIAKAAATALSNENLRKGIGWGLVAALSPVILLIAALCSIGTGGADHNNHAVAAAFYGTSYSTEVPMAFRSHIEEMRSAFSLLDSAVVSVNGQTEGGNSLDPIRVKAVFYALCFGEDAPGRRAAIEELLTSYPDDYFQLMTPCGFVDLTPSETEKLLHGEATMAHPGVSGCQMPVEAQELLEMEVLSLKRDEHGCWYALTDHPQQKMEQAPQEPQML